MPKTLLRYVLASIMIGGGSLHFLARPTFLRLMPPYVPAHDMVVSVSGVVEAGLGLLLLFPRTYKAAAWALIPVYIAIFPANLYGATTAGTDHEAMPGIPPLLAWLRLPLQAVLISWAYWYTRDNKEAERVTR